MAEGSPSRKETAGRVDLRLREESGTRGDVKQAEEEEVFAGLNFAAFAQFLLRVEMGVRNWGRGNRSKGIHVGGIRHPSGKSARIEEMRST